jgi:hypothetical protein
MKHIHIISVADPDPLDPLVFGPPGYGSISQRYGSGSRSESFYHHVKIGKKNLGLENYFSVEILKVNDKKSRIRIR